MSDTTDGTVIPSRASCCDHRRRLLLLRNLQFEVEPPRLSGRHLCLEGVQPELTFGQDSLCSRDSEQTHDDERGCNQN